MTPSKMTQRRKESLEQLQRRMEGTSECPNCGEKLVDSALGCGFCALEAGDDWSLEAA